MGLFLSVLALAAAAAAAPEKINPLYLKAGQYPYMVQLRAQMAGAIRSGDKKKMAEVCATALKADPSDAVWQYNYACALADGDDAEAALAALEKAVEIGFRDADKIAGDADFAKIAKQPRFKKAVQKARDTAKDPIPGVPVPQVLEVKAGRAARLTESNLVWNADLGMYQALVKGDGDLYVNRDANHSCLNVGAFPKVSRLDFPKGARKTNADLNLPNTLYGGMPVFGNVSRGYHEMPVRRSMLRAAMTGLYEGDIPFRRLAACYLDNQVWVVPAVWDFPGLDYYGKPVGQGGDVYYPAQCPYAVTSVGASCTDLPFLRAVLTARAKMRPDTLKAMRERHLVGPTTQWLLRRSHARVAKPGDYLTEKAHPTAYNIKDLNTNALYGAAAALKPSDLPPVAFLQVVNTKVDPAPLFAPLRDYADDRPEFLYATPCAIAIVLRAEPGRRTFCFRALAPEKDLKGVEFAWKVVHGDPKRVKVSGFSGTDTPKKGFARVEIDRIGMTNRIDLACFARSRGTDWGAPSFVSFSVVAQEAREYDANGRLLSIDYTNPHKAPYLDGLIALPRKWKDEYAYGADGKLKSVTRTQPGAEPRVFTADAFRKLQYLPRKSTDKEKYPELTYAEN